MPMHEYMHTYIYTSVFVLHIPADVCAHTHRPGIKISKHMCINKYIATYIPLRTNIVNPIVFMGIFQQTFFPTKDSHGFVAFVACVDHEVGAGSEGHGEVLLWVLRHGKVRRDWQHLQPWGRPDPEICGEFWKPTFINSRCPLVI